MRSGVDVAVMELTTDIRKVQLTPGLGAKTALMGQHRTSKNRAASKKSRLNVAQNCSRSSKTRSRARGYPQTARTRFCLSPGHNSALQADGRVASGEDDAAFSFGTCRVLHPTNRTNLSRQTIPSNSSLKMPQVALKKSKPSALKPKAKVVRYVWTSVRLLLC